VLNHLTPAQHQALVGRAFFPHLISAPFRTGLHEAFIFAIIACLVAAAASWSRGGKLPDTDAPGRAAGSGPPREPEPEPGAGERPSRRQTVAD
jgi:hypothetical protein